MKELGSSDGHHHTLAEPGAWQGGFREAQVSATALEPGQYLTIKARRDARHQRVTDTVQIVRPDGAAGSRW
jgi:hypothetical protein